MDRLIRRVLIYDGSGSRPFCGDILIRGKEIAQISIGIETGPETEIIDGTGKTATPGFIDIHRHCDIAPFISPRFGEIELAQGITTAFVGNCGLAPVPAVPKWQTALYDYLEPVIGSMDPADRFLSYEDYFQSLSRADLPIHMGVLAGVNSIKVSVKGFGNESYTKDELRQARAQVVRALDCGAFGLTLGIMYQPECYSAREELAAVVQAASGRSAVLCAHIRSEGDSLAESVDEVIDVAARAGLPLNISHLKATGVKNWNRNIFAAIERIEAARMSGQDVTADFYPYDGGATTLLSLIPPSLMAEPVDGIRGQRLKEELQKNHNGWDNMAKSIGWERILISSVTLEKHTPMLGKSIGELALKSGGSDPADLVADLLREERGKVGIIVLSMSRQDVDTVAGLPYTMLISDSLYGGDSKHAHPRLMGTTAKFLQEYVLKRKVLPMETAIKKMTSMPAARMGLCRRGLLREGYRADLLLFDPAHFTDHAGYTGSRGLCTGLSLVLLEGKKVFENGNLLSRNGGRLLKHDQERQS